MIIAVWFIVAMGFVNSEINGIICNQVEITLKDNVKNRFVTVSDVRNIIENLEKGIQGYALKDINIRDLEHHLENYPYIRNAEVFNDVSGKLSIDIYQREPLIRIMPENGKGFYIDRDGYFLPLSKNYTALIIMASGKIKSPDNIGNKKSLHAFSKEESEKYSHLKDLYVFGSYIAGHPFWSGQIVQIYVNSNAEYELIPRVGAHQILLGSMDDYEVKLKNLEALYRQGLSRYGWNNYDKINLKYINQVICTKR
ncbi:MAG TPA: hypothetical protein ENN61_03475 [Bacteroidaceae bacterium]|nr:hypothetical protein [Bacteroidaceae bacterium]